MSKNRFLNTEMLTTTMAVSPSILIGSGYDNRTKTVLNIVAEGDYIADPVATAEPEYTIDWCDNYSKLYNFFSLSAAASYSGATAGVSAGVKIVKATTIETSRIYIAVSMRVLANLQNLPKAKLTSDALASLQSESLANFAEKYGGIFVKALYRGGELACILEISASATETIEQLKIFMSAQGWGAKAAGETEQLLIQLTTNRSTVVRYCQAGGSVGKTASGIVVTTVPEVIARMREFTKEVWGTNGVDGNAIPLKAEFSNLRTLINWPKDHAGDPNRPYPDAIEQIAKSILLIKDKKLFAQSVLDTLGVSPAAIEVAMAYISYIDAILSQAEVQLVNIVRGASQEIGIDVETLNQRRLRILLDVNPGMHLSAGQRVDLALNDPNQIIERLFGPRLPDLYEPWPKLYLREQWWGYQGQEPGYGAYGSFQVICWQHGGNVQTTAMQLAGNPNLNEGIYVLGAASPYAYQGGGACGYSPVHVIDVRTEKPTRPILDPLPTIISDPIPVTNFTLSDSQYFQIGENLWELSCLVSSVAYPSSCGKFIFCINLESKVSGFHKTLNFYSYWIKKNQLEFRILQHIALEDGWLPKSFDVVVELVYPV